MTTKNNGANTGDRTNITSILEGDRKTCAVLLRDRASAEQAARFIITKQIERERLVAARDAEIATINEKHNGNIDAATSEIDLHFQLLEDWADRNRENEFGDAKSMIIAGHRLGWRTGTPKVAPRGKLSLKTILERLVKLGGEMKERFVREKPELDKEAILGLNRVAEGRDPALTGLEAEIREQVITAARENLRAIGVDIIQNEAFYFEPDRDGQADIRLTGEAKEAA